MTMIFTGGCQCGGLRYTAEGEPVNQRICHCRLCQRAIGAAFNARVLMKGEDVHLEGEAATMHTSPDLVRGFCGSCGTTLFSRRLSTGYIGLTTGAMDDPSLFRPDMHFWVSSRQPWVALDDGLPQFEGFPPA